MEYFIQQIFSMLSYLLITLFLIIPVTALFSLIVYVFSGWWLYNNIYKKWK